MASVTQDDNRLRILHILSQRPDSTGSGIYLQAMVREAAARGHANFMIAGIQYDREAELDGIEADQCRFVRFNGGDIAYRIPGMTDIMPYPHTRFRDLSAADLKAYEAVFTRVLTKTVARFSPDIIHSHHLWLLSSLTRRLFPEIPLVVSCHGTDLRQFRNCPHLRARVLAGCARLDAVLALSAAQKADIQEIYGLPPEHVVVVGAGYDDQRFVPGPKPVPPPVEFVYAGKFIRAKGLPWLLRALGRMAAPDWRLHLVGGGSGEEHAECLRLADALGDRVVVHGQVPQARLAVIFRQAHVFVLSSFFEGLPLVVLEALASGCRVVATDLPGVQAVAAGLPDEYLTRVSPPRLHNLDQPHAGDLPAFEEDLARALARQMTVTRAQPEIDLATIADPLTAFSWRGIFARIEPIYRDRIRLKAG
jgi:glycosyltransferase involved in cell wall biosynthesis